MRRATGLLRRVAALAAPALLAVGVASAPAAAANLYEDFETDPRLKPAWDVQGSFVWSGRAGLIRADCSSQQAAAWWLRDRWGAGTLSARIRLDGGAVDPSQILLAFARDPATGAFRWVRITGGEHGVIAVGQSGIVDGRAGRVFGAAGGAFPAATWLTVLVTIEADGRIRVGVNGVQLLQVFVGTRPAEGQVGLFAPSGRVAITEFGMRHPRPAGCIGCHDGRNPDPEYPLAADVFTYWNGRWWDRTQGGLPGVQQGGHGDPGGEPAVGCTGARGCHDLTTPLARARHLDGVRGGRGAATSNTYHLKPEFFTRYPANDPAGEYGVQVAFDNYCAFACHTGWQERAYRDMRHERDTQEGDPGHRSLELGTHFTRRSINLAMDCDLNSEAAGGKNFVPCVACHDPHGTGITKRVSRGGNRMLRLDDWGGGEYCASCHH